MEIAQLCKSAHNNQVQQSIYLCHKRNMSQIWQMNTLCRAKAKGHTMMHTYTSQSMFLPSVSLLHLTEFKSLDKIL